MARVDSFVESKSCEWQPALPHGVTLADPDIHVNDDGVRLSDPLRANILAALGGGVGLLTSGYDPNTMTQAICTAHERSWGWSRCRAPVPDIEEALLATCTL